MLLHEVLEKAATSFLIFRDILLKRRYRHSAHVGYREDSGNLNAQGEPFDVAVEFPRRSAVSNVEFIRSCCSTGTRMVLKPMAISNSSASADAQTSAPAEFSPLRERPMESDRTGSPPFNGQARELPARLPDERIALLPLRGAH